MITTWLSIDLADSLPLPLPAECEFEFPVIYTIYPAQPARFYPWPGDPAEPEEVEVQTCASDVAADAWLWYSNQFAGLPPISRHDFLELFVQPIDKLIGDHSYDEY